MSAISQVWLPSVVLGSLNVAAAAAAPVLDALRNAGRQLAAGGGWRIPGGSIGRDPGAGWRELFRLVRRPCLRPENGGAFARGAPAATVAISLAVLPLVPGVATWTGLSRIADLPTLVILLAAARATMLLGVMEGGDPGAVLRAQAGLLAMARGALGMIVAFLAVVVVAGETGMEHVLAMLRGSAITRDGVDLLLCGAVAAAAWTADVEVPDGSWSGSDLAMCRYATMLRRVAWVELISALLVPAAVATPDTGGTGWLLAAVGFLARLVVGSVVLGVGQGMSARFGLRRMMLGSSVLLSILAMVAGGTVTGGAE